ncbi:hypothetical protein [Caproiciproducens sp. CPB-2]|uniref:hypothetical protein n=1 Tax=Caproiciproducens sp. CPB-2 TaxID=3030017 RepID=UPI0023DCAE2D|nr:hypothetical protein [Caproiciproducens sp. CPB-2]MDF1495374.1 hypothetical protein [Caproiciproducens sp. CPB-2]
MIKRRAVCVLMVLLVAAAALAGCSSGKTSQNAGEKTESGLNRENRQEGTRTGTKDSGAKGDSSSQSQNQIIGKVTSIVGNEVELELGTMSGESGSGEFVSSGETKTLLIPVGLSLSGSGTGGTAQAGGTAGVGEAGAQQGGAPGGTAAGQTGTGTSANRSGSAKSGSTTKTTAGTAAAGTATKRTSGFSSITAGMVLRISQKEVNGTLTVVKVAVVSK